jgi:hypothetical protein
MAALGLDTSEIEAILHCQIEWIESQLIRKMEQCIKAKVESDMHPVVSE